MFDPQKGYRDLRFGMSPDEVEEIVGSPKEIVNLWDEFEHDDEDIEFMRGRRSYVYEGYAPFHEHLELIFKNDRLVEIYLQDAKQPVMFGDLDLYQKDRMAVMTRLFELDKELYGIRSHAFFGNLGLRIAWAKQWKKYPVVIMVDSDDFFETLSFQNHDDFDELL